jgi:UTP--glucose-1-phosphate uridylyltransferase
LESLPDTGSVSFTRQQKPLGLGHAVLCARHLVGNEPFAVVLPDDLMVGKPGALKQMVEAYNEIGGGVIVAAEEKPREETQRYGVIDPGRSRGSITEVKGVVEKPKPAEAPSTLCVIGRYILPPEIFAELERRERGAGNEIQLTDAMARLLGRVPFHAVTTTCARYDCGDKIGFLQANIAVALERPDIAPGLQAHTLDAELGLNGIQLPFPGIGCRDDLFEIIIGRLPTEFSLQSGGIRDQFRRIAWTAPCLAGRDPASGHLRDRVHNFSH